MNTASATIAEKILAFLDPFVRRTYNEIAEGIGEDPRITYIALQELWLDKHLVLSELRGSLCCKCGAMRARRDCNGKSWSTSLAHEMSDPLLQRDGFPEGSALIVHSTNLRTDEEVERAGDTAFAKWVDMEYGRRLLYGRLRQADLPRAERDAAEYARAR